MWFVFVEFDKIKIIDICGRVWTGNNEIKIVTAIMKK